MPEAIAAKVSPHATSVPADRLFVLARNENMNGSYDTN